MSSNKNISTKIKIQNQILLNIIIDELIWKREKIKNKD